MKFTFQKGFSFLILKVFCVLTWRSTAFWLNPVLGKCKHENVGSSPVFCYTPETLPDILPLALLPCPLSLGRRTSQRRLFSRANWQEHFPMTSGERGRSVPRLEAENNRRFTAGPLMAFTHHLWSCFCLLPLRVIMIHRKVVQLKDYDELWVTGRLVWGQRVARQE